MFVPVPVRDCRAAIAAAIEAANKTIESDRAAYTERSFDQLHSGAVHNGLKPSESDLAKMREMVANDVEHSMDGHPQKGVINHLNSMVEMLDYYDDEDDETIVDLAEFQVLKPHLPAKQKG